MSRAYQRKLPAGAGSFLWWDKSRKTYRRRFERRADFFAAFFVVFFAVFLLAVFFAAFRFGALRFAAFLATLRLFAAIDVEKKNYVKDIRLVVPESPDLNFRCALQYKLN